MIAAAVTFALFGFILTMVVDVIRRDGDKIAAALEGRSIGARAGRPVTVRFSRPDRGAAPVPALPPLRAAA